MIFTALHLAAGAQPGPITDELLDAAVAAQAVETDDLDWKAKLPDIKGIGQGDFPKDVAAMANRGGGVIVFGVEEDGKAATWRVDVGELSEGHERALRSAAVSAIMPPIFGLGIHRLDGGDYRAVVAVIPDSVDGPHLIYRNQFFGAPLRNDADTVWMKEREIEAMYRARFEARRQGAEALDALYTEAVRGRDTDRRAWLIAVAHPRMPQLPGRLTAEQATAEFDEAFGMAYLHAADPRHPLETGRRNRIRPGLRRWIIGDSAIGSVAEWAQAWASIHHDGSVVIAAVAGGESRPDRQQLDPWVIDSRRIECIVVDHLMLIRRLARFAGSVEYDTRIGIEWTGREPLRVVYPTFEGILSGDSVALAHYSPVETTVNAAASDDDFHEQIYEIALDCVNQAGIERLHLAKLPDRSRQISG